MANETIEEFLARGGKIKEVCVGCADNIIKSKKGVFTRYHFTEKTTKLETDRIIQNGEKVIKRAFASKRKRGKNV